MKRNMMIQGLNQDRSKDSLEIATLAGGCFWCLEAVYDQLKGVEDVVSGYSGGSQPNPSYRQVCTGSTGHAEVVQIQFDPQKSLREILKVFFTIHVNYPESSERRCGHSIARQSSIIRMNRKKPANR
jgi:methionine-S-sulfoxide reductase